MNGLKRGSRVPGDGMGYFHQFSCKEWLWGGMGIVATPKVQKKWGFLNV